MGAGANLETDPDPKRYGTYIVLAAWKRIQNAIQARLLLFETREQNPC